MRPITLAGAHTLGDFNALLAGREFAYAEAFTLRLLSGTNLFYTNAQRDFTAPACDGSGLTTYDADDVLIDGLRFKIGNGEQPGSADPSTAIEVDEQTVTFTPNVNGAAPSMIDAVPFITAAGRGALDGATIQRDRWFFPGPGQPPVGGMPMFYGLTSSLDQLGRTQVVMKVKSDVARLNIMMPRNLYQPNCVYTVYSTGCGADKAAFVQHGVVGAAPSRAFIPWTGASAQFALGTVFMETGPNTNQTRTIRAADSTGLYLTYPLPVTPGVGDAFAAWPGCDRTYAGGCAYFSRQTAFRATEFVPNAEMAV